MKKLFLVLFSTVFLFGCSSDGDSGSNTSFNPPSWIQGRWIEENLNFMGYRFTNNDVMLITGTSESSFGEDVKFFNNAGGDASINQGKRIIIEKQHGY